MTDSTTTGGTPGRGRIRAGDEDRDRTVERLRLHHGAGRLDPEEFNERMEAALGAKYLDELGPLLVDLPGEGRHWDDSRRFGYGPSWTDSRREARGGWSDGRQDWRSRWPVIPIVPILFVLAVVGSIAAMVQGHFPFPLLWVALLLFWLRPWGRSRWWGAWGRRPRR